MDFQTKIRAGAAPVCRRDLGLVALALEMPSQQRRNTWEELDDGVMECWSDGLRYHSTSPLLHHSADL